MKFSDTEKFLGKLARIQQLVTRGATEPEREAARNAIARMVAHARLEARDLPAAARISFLAGLQAFSDEALIDDPKSPPKPSRRWSESFDGSHGGDAEPGSASSEPQRRSRWPSFAAGADVKQAVGSGSLSGRVLAYAHSLGGDHHYRVLWSNGIESEAAESLLVPAVRRAG